MSDELRNFVGDLVELLKEKYNDALRGSQDPTEDAYNLGVAFAYYDALDLIHSQLTAFGYDAGDFKVIVPVLGQKA